MYLTGDIRFRVQEIAESYTLVLQVKVCDIDKDDDSPFFWRDAKTEDFAEIKITGASIDSINRGA